MNTLQNPSVFIRIKQIYRFYCGFGLCTIGVLGCSSVDDTFVVAPFERVAERTEVEVDFVKQALGPIQQTSFLKNREYCGFIGLDERGNYITTKPKRGKKGSCLAKAVSNDFQILASYHTHGGYAEGYDSEIPSKDDLIGDIEEGIDGYISTPGGRVWFSNARAQRVELICAEACLFQDPDYDPLDMTDVKSVYTLEDLLVFGNL